MRKLSFIISMSIIALNMNCNLLSSLFGKSQGQLISIIVAPTNTTVDPTSAFIGETIALTATGGYLNGTMPSTQTITTATWSSSNPATATVDAMGNVTILGAGTVTITASDSGKTGSLPINVLPNLTATSGVIGTGTTTVYNILAGTPGYIHVPLGNPTTGFHITDLNFSAITCPGCTGVISASGYNTDGTGIFSNVISGATVTPVNVTASPVHIKITPTTGGTAAFVWQ